MRVRRWGAGVVVAAAAALTVACGGGAVEEDPTPEPTTVTPEPTPTPEPTAEPEPEVDDEAAVLDVYFRYWDAAVAAQRGDPDPALFEGIVVGPLLEDELRQARNMVEWEVVREGEPGISDTTVRIDGDRAVVSSCVDYSTWVVPEADNSEVGAQGNSVELERIDDQWFVVAFVPLEVELSC